MMLPHVCGAAAAYPNYEERAGLLFILENARRRLRYRYYQDLYGSPDAGADGQRAIEMTHLGSLHETRRNPKKRPLGMRKRQIWMAARFPQSAVPVSGTGRAGRSRKCSAQLHASCHFIRTRTLSPEALWRAETVTENWATTTRHEAFLRN